MGGRESLRGYLIQLIYCLSESLNDGHKWKEFCIEPHYEGEEEEEKDKVDVSWISVQGVETIVQIWHSQNQISIPIVKKRAKAIKSVHPSTKMLEVVIFGSTSRGALKMKEFEGVKVLGPYPPNINSLMKQVNSDLAKYYESKDFPILAPRCLEIIVKGLLVELAIAAIDGSKFVREEYEKILSNWFYMFNRCSTGLNQNSTKDITETTLPIDDSLRFKHKIEESLRNVETRLEGFRYGIEDFFDYPIQGFAIDNLCQENIYLGENLSKALNKSGDLLKVGWNGKQPIPNIATQKIDWDFFAEDFFILIENGWKVNVSIKYLFQYNSKQSIANFLIQPVNIQPHFLPVQKSSPFRFIINLDQFPRTCSEVKLFDPTNKNEIKDDRLSFAFTALFQYIDEVSSRDCFHWVDWGMSIDRSDNKPKDMYESLSAVSNLLKKNEFLQPLIINVLVYVPIIIINGDILKINSTYDYNVPLENEKNKILGFISRMTTKNSNLNYQRPYFHLWNVTGRVMQNYGARQDRPDFRDEILINLTSPEMDVLTLSLDQFESSLTTIVKEFREQIKVDCRKWFKETTTNNDDILRCKKEHTFYGLVFYPPLGSQLIVEGLLQYLSFRAHLNSILRLP